MPPLDRRQNFFDGQTVSPAELARFEDATEASDARVLAAAGLALGLGGYVVSGLALSPDSATLVVPVSAGMGVASHTDGNGNVGLPWVVRLASGASIDLTGHVPVAQPRHVAVCLRWQTADSYQRTDNAGVTAPYWSDDSSALVAIDGAEGGDVPSIPLDHVVLADVRLAVGQTAVHPADVDVSRAKPAWAKSVGGPAQQLADLAAVALDNCRPCIAAPQSDAANAMKVGVRPGSYDLSDRRVTVAGGLIAIAASPSGGMHRIALVYVDTAGALQVAYGAEVAYVAQAAAPTFEGRYPLCTLDVADTTTVLSATGNSFVDVRPFARMVRDTPNRYTMVAVGGETVITPGWSFVVGAHALEVYDNGVLVDESGYTEAADGSHITLGTPAIAGHRITLRASRVAGTNPVTTHAASHAPGGADPITPGAFDGLIAPKVHAASHAADAADAIDYSAIGGMVCPGFVMSSETDGRYVTIGSFSAVVGGRLRAFDTVTTIDLTSAPVDGVVGPAGNSAPANAWLYVYAAWVGGVGVIELSQTVPYWNGRTKNGDTSRTFLGVIRTTSGANHRAKLFVQQDRQVTYLVDSANDVAPDTTDVANLCAAAITGTTSAQSVDLSGFVPSWVQSVRATVVFTSGTTGHYVTVAGNGGARGAAKITSPGYPVCGEYTLFLGGAQSVQVALVSVGDTVALWPVSYRV